MQFGFSQFSFDREKCMPDVQNLKAVDSKDCNFMPVSFAPLCTDRCKQTDMALREYLLSYMDALHTMAGQVLYDHATCDEKGNVRRFMSESTVLPGLYLACHITELILKYTLQTKFNEPVGHTHDLMKLWKKLEPLLAANLTASDCSVLADMSEFIKMMRGFSRKDNTQFRYAIDASNSLSQGDMMIVDLNVISHCVDMFVYQMLSLDVPELHAPKLKYRAKLKDYTSYTERWSFGFEYNANFMGAYICESILHVPYLEIISFTLDQKENISGLTCSGDFDLVLIDKARMRPGYVAQTICGLCAKGFSHGWTIRAKRKDADIVFMGTLHGADVSVSYADRETGKLLDLMRYVYKHVCNIRKVSSISFVTVVQEVQKHDSK